MTDLMRVAPELPVDDLDQSLLHYRDRLGFHMAMTMPAGDYAIVERDAVALHLFRRPSAAVSPVSVHVFVGGLDDLWAELQARGAQVTHGIARQPWGNRDFRVTDPSGNVLKFTEPAGGGG